MQERLADTPFILALRDDYTRAMRELRIEEMQRVGGGLRGCHCLETMTFTVDMSESPEIQLDCD
jgi:hypothetical protein